MAVAGSLTYNSTVTTVQALTLENERRWTPNTAPNTDRTEFFLNLDKDAQPQIDTITVDATLPAVNAYYVVTIAGPATTGAYTYRFLTASGDTDAIIETRLAQLINLHPEVTAAIDAGNIKVTSLLPGTNGAFTTTVECFNAATGAAIAGEITVTSVAGTGTGKVRKIGEFNLEMLVDASGAPQVRATGTWFNGAAPPVAANTFGPTPYSAPKKVDDYRATP